MQITVSFDASLSYNGAKVDTADIGPFEITVNIPDRGMVDQAEFESQIIRETGPALQAVTNMILDAGLAHRVVEAALRAELDSTDDNERRDQLQVAADAAANATPPGEVPSGVKTDEERRQDENLPLPGEPGSPEPLEVATTEVGGQPDTLPQAEAQTEPAVVEDADVAAPDVVETDAAPVTDTTEVDTADAPASE